ncbi:hypothetical protein C8J57DRAFT_1225876 [Mycena rebaudengoi]|nr:hypothetical protein C8J57DRAFT_1225876 [Mycena rebaudengoi]
MMVLADGEVTLFERGPVHQPAWAQTTPVWSTGIMGYISGPDQYNFLSERLLKRTRSMVVTSGGAGAHVSGKTQVFRTLLCTLGCENMTGKACKCEGFSSWADTWRGSRLCSYGMRPLAIERCCAIAIHTARAPPCQSKPSQNTNEPRVAKTMDMWCQPMHGTLPPSTSPSRPPRLERVGRHEPHPQEEGGIHAQRGWMGTKERLRGGSAGIMRRDTKHQTPAEA